MLTYILDRLKERSTWLGLVTIVTTAGVAFDAAQAEAIVLLGVAIAGAVAAFTKDKK
jgi:hypothetical protein